MSRPSERLGAAILAAAADAVVIFPREGTILEFNAAAERMFGFTEAEVLGVHFKEMLVDPPHEQARHMVRLGEPFEMGAQRKDGTRFPVDLVVVAIPDTDPILFAAFVRSIHKRKDIERQLVQARDAAEAANQAKSNFLAFLSHEIRTPLNVLAGMTEIFEETPLTLEQREILGEIRGSSELVLRLVNDLLDLAKLETGQIDVSPRPFALRDLLAGAHQLIRRKAADKGVELILPPNAGDEILVGDPGRLQEILINLLSNAIKFTERGSVHLELSLEDAPRDSRRVQFTVRDTGIGIAPEDQERIFQSFFQASGGQRGGAGLGLSIASGLAYMMGGRLWLQESTAGAGSTFCFEVVLPKLDPATAALPLTPPPAAAGPARVLLAEDHEPNRRILLRFLESGGHQVTVAVDGLEAVQRAIEREYDIILLDLEMPHLDGIEAARRIRGFEHGYQRPAATVVALTAHTFQDFRERALAAGMNHFLVKPVRKQELLDRIDGILAERQVAQGRRETAHDPGAEAEAETPLLVRIDPDIADLAEEYLTDRRAEVEEQEARLLRGEISLIMVFAHNLKGSAGAYGFQPLSQLGAQLQQASTAGDIRQTRELLREIASYLRRVRPLV